MMAEVDPTTSLSTTMTGLSPATRAITAAITIIGPEAASDAMTIGLAPTAFTVTSMAENSTTTPLSTATAMEASTAGLTTTIATPAPDDIFQLRVRPIVKASINQRDTFAETLSDATFKGNSFGAIMEALWERFSCRIKQKAVKNDGVWGVETPELTEWAKLLQFKAKKRVVDSSKSDHMWNQWLVGMQGANVTLMIYEYGTAIATAKDRKDFMKACILPEETDRAGATAESSLREVVTVLRQKWDTTFQAASIVWTMWANHVTRNLNRSTWSSDIAAPPPAYIANLRDPVESRLEAHLTGTTQSASVALDCVKVSIADCQQQRRHLEAALRCLDDQEIRLEAREAIFEGMIQDLVPPSPSEIVNPLPLNENIEDAEHAE